MKSAFEQYRAELDAIREAGTYKNERIITTPQYSRINTTEANGVVNMCANNYLGLSAHPRLIKAAKRAMISGASDFLLYVLSAVHRRSTKSLRERSQTS